MVWSGLELYDYIAGSFSIAFVIVSIIIGIKIISKHKDFREKAYILVGLTWIFISEPWWPSSISFLIALFTNTNGLLSAPSIYFIIGNIFVPLTTLIWLAAITEFLFQEKRKMLLIIFAVYGIGFEAIFFYFLFTDLTLIGHLEGLVDVTYKFVVMGYLLSMIAVLLVPGLLFALHSRKFEDPEVKLKGNLLIAAFISFAIGAILDSAIPLNEIAVIVTRLILISSAIEWYGGFILPKWMRKIFMKSK